MKRCIKNFLKNKTNLLLLFILCVAAFLRLYRIQDYMTFLGDEGRDVLVVYNILHGHFTLLGPTSSVGGFFLGPIYYYFMAPFLLLFNYNPVGPAVMIALLGVVTVWLVYYVTTKFFNQTAGFIAAGLYTISPLVLTYSRSSWNPNPMPFFTLLTLYLLYKLLTENKKKYSIIAGILFGIMMQLHYLATFVGVIIALYILIGRFAQHLFVRKTNYTAIMLQVVRDYLLFLFGFLIGFSPFIVFEARHGFQNTRNIITFIFHSKDTGGNNHYFSIVYDIFFRLFGRLVTSYPTADHFSWFNPTALTLWYLFTLLVAIVSIVGLGYAFVQKKKNYHEFLQRLLLAMWLVVGILMFGFYKKNIYDYYFEFMFPLPFILFGGAIAYIYQKNLFTKVVASVLVGVCVIMSLLGVPFRYEPNRQLNQMETISRFVLSKTNNQPFNFALITGGNSDYAYRYFFTVWGHPPVTIENTINDPQRTSVTNQLLVVCESIPCYPLGNSLFEVAGFGRADIVGHWNVSVVEVYRLIHYKGL